jgi:hypothetical protein
MRLIISEEERTRIINLYEQTETQVAELNNIATELLPSNFINVVNKELIQNKQIQDEINKIYNEELPNNPLSYLQSKGINPYLFIVPNYVTGVGFPTTGLAVKIGNTPITVSLNLGTNIKEIPNSLKFSQVRMNFPITK